MQLDGAKCNYTPNSTYADNDPYYSGSWGSYNRPYSVYGLFNMNLTRAVGYHRGFYLLEESRLQCEPSRGKYDVAIKYDNGLRTFSHQVTEVKTLFDTFVGGIAPDTGEYPDYKPNTSIPWTQEMIGNLRNINHYAVIDTIVSTLTGSYDQAMSVKPAPTFPYTLPNGTIVDFEPMGALFTIESDQANRSGAIIEGNSMEIRV
jgi:hypothetical protein